MVLLPASPRSGRLSGSTPAATRRRSSWIWLHRAASRAVGLRQRRTPAFSISPWNLPTRAAPIRRTLSRASRDFLKTDARFCLKVGRLAIQRIFEGYGYELTGIDVLDAF